jgi:hypothetical protein
LSLTPEKKRTRPSNKYVGPIKNWMYIQTNL